MNCCAWWSRARCATTRKCGPARSSSARLAASSNGCWTRPIPRKAAEERQSQRLENSYNENERRIAALKQTRDDRLGALKELFGVTQQVAGDARSNFESSLTNVQYPERTEFLTSLVEKLGSGIELPSIEEMEQLWFELQREMTESSKVVRFNTDVISLGGEREPTEVARVGLFNIVADGKYLTYRPETGQRDRTWPPAGAGALHRQRRGSSGRGCG